MRDASDVAGLGAWLDTDWGALIMGNRKFYTDLAVEAALPISERPESIPARNGEMSRVRRHHMSMDDQVMYRQRALELGRFVAPYRTGGVYWGIVETLSLLGENKEHLFSVFWQKFIDVMSDESLSNAGRTPWEIFSGRPLRSRTTGKNVVEKVEQNIRVLQRLGGTNPYGLKLAQLNACIDVLGNQKEMRLRLRTGIENGAVVLPVREIRRKAFTPTTMILAGYSVSEGTDGAPGMMVQVDEAIGLAESEITSNQVVDGLGKNSGKAQG